MTVFDLLFLALVCTTVVMLLLVVARIVLGRRTQALRLLRSLGVGAAVYLGALLLVSAFTPQRYIGIGDTECSDDWCVAVESVRRLPLADHVQYDVAFLLSNRARRVAQRERFVDAYLVDDQGQRHPPKLVATSIPFDTLIHVGESIEALRQFVVPANAQIAGLVITRAGAGRIPGCCIIGDENSFFHRRTIIKLDSVVPH